MSERTKYACIMSDCPWRFDNKIDTFKDGVKRGAHQHYDLMDLEDIKWFLRYTPQSVIWNHDGTRPSHNGVMLEDLIADDAVLLLWAPSTHILGGQAAQVVGAWGFVAKQIITWRKVSAKGAPKIQLGHYCRNATEHMILAVRGKAKTNVVLSHSIPNVFDAIPTRHSAKPDEGYRLAERLLKGPRLSLFERRFIPGWDCVGMELAEEMIDVDESEAA